MNYLFSGGHQPISITENTSVDEFLSNAEAAQRSFEAERGTAAIAVSNRCNEWIQNSNSSSLCMSRGGTKIILNLIIFKFFRI